MKKDQMWTFIGLGAGLWLWWSATERARKLEAEAAFWREESTKALQNTLPRKVVP